MAADQAQRREARRAEVDIIERAAREREARAEESRAAPRKAELPEFVTPQLATLVTEPPTSGDWVYEVKHDGYRMLARIAANGESRSSRAPGNDWTAKLPHLAKAVEKLGARRTAWLDGEIVVPGADGRASFQALQNAFDAGARREHRLLRVRCAFPRRPGPARSCRLRERKKRLEKVLKGIRTRAVQRAPRPATRSEVLEHACKLELEGLIGKQADSVYVVRPHARAGSSSSAGSARISSSAATPRRRARATASARCSSASTTSRGKLRLRRQGRHRLRRRAARQPVEASSPR